MTPAGLGGRRKRSVGRSGGPQRRFLSRPLPACPAGEAVHWLEAALLAAELLHLPDKPAGVEGKRVPAPPAGELLHLPDKPAGVEGKRLAALLAAELLHLPDKPAGGITPQSKNDKTRECYR